ncbi:MAG TPA: DUF982 domain-containing protein [Ensifer sp.]|nr:DUF982 domain-containing protein [Ensifer sp.]
MLTFDIKWISPIHVGLFEDEATVVEGPMQALALLHDDWPASGGKHHQTAIQECKLACHELGRSEKAREAFMAAALEAGTLIFAHRKHTVSKRPLMRRSVGDKGLALPL